MMAGCPVNGGGLATQYIINAAMTPHDTSTAATRLPASHSNRRSQRRGLFMARLIARPPVRWNPSG